jgi:hypothetical protein
MEPSSTITNSTSPTRRLLFYGKSEVMIGTTLQNLELEVMIVAKPAMQNQAGPTAITLSFQSGTTDLYNLDELPLLPTGARPSPGDSKSQLAFVAAGQDFVIASSGIFTLPFHYVIRTTSAGEQCSGSFGCLATTKCPVGFHKRYDDEMSPCMPCPAGTFQNSTGQPTCNVCSLSQQCPAGSSSPLVPEVHTTNSLFRFPVRESTPSLQQTMFLALISATSPTPEFFRALVIAVVILLILFAVLVGLQHFGKAARFVLCPSITSQIVLINIDFYYRLVWLLKKIDMFKEPQVERTTLRLRDEGSLLGWLATSLGSALLIVCMSFVIYFYGEYVAYGLVMTGGGVGQQRGLGSNNQHTEALRPYGPDFADSHVEYQLVDRCVPATIPYLLPQTSSLTAYDRT